MEKNKIKISPRRKVKNFLEVMIKWSVVSGWICGVFGFFPNGDHWLILGISAIHFVALIFLGILIVCGTIHYIWYSKHAKEKKRDRIAARLKDGTLTERK